MRSTPIKADLLNESGEGLGIAGDSTRHETTPIDTNSKGGSQWLKRRDDHGPSTTRRRHTTCAMPPDPAAVTDSDIARRAYELYEQRGGEHGRDLDDWLLAENELRDAARSTAA